MADYAAADDAAAPASPEKQEDYGKGGPGLVSRWLAEIALYDKQFAKWQKRGAGIVKRYRDERDETDTAKRVNILWSNIQVLQPAIYARPPAPDVQRRYKDRDPIGRVAATALERALSYTVDTAKLDAVLKLCRDDYLLVARGQAWVRYEFEEGEPKIDEDGQSIETVENEKAVPEYVFWQDFGHTPARVWSEVRAVWRRVYLTRDKLVEKFGEKIGGKVPLDTEPAALDDDQKKKYGAVFKTACVYEIWDKESRRTLWIAKGYSDGPLKIGPPPIDFDGFFPCPEPIYGTLTTDCLVPIPDFAQYQDQADEIDILTERIGLLVSAVRAAGVYDGSIKDKLGPVLQLNSLVSGEAKNILIPVDSWAAFAEKGGLQGAISWLPLDQIIQAIKTLFEARAQVKQELLEVTGLSDIVRGQGNPNETATAQEIKGRFASMRLTDRQNAFARFARDIIRLCAEVIAEQFSAETLMAMTGVELPATRAEAAMMGHNGGPPLDDTAAMPMQQPMGGGPMGGMPQGMTTSPAPAMAPAAPSDAIQMPPQAAPPPVGQAGLLPGPAVPPAAPAAEPPSWEAVIALLRDDLERGFRIDIETDSTIALDEEADKKAGIELLNVAAPFFEKLARAAAQMPAMVPLMAETFMQVIRRFKLGRNIEQTFEETIQQLRQMAKQPKADPTDQALKLKQAETQADIAIRKAQAGADEQLANQKAAADLRLKQAQMAAEQRRKDAETAHEMQRMAAEHALKREEMHLNHDLKRDQAALDFDLKTAQAGADHVLARDKMEGDQAITQQKFNGEPNAAAPPRSKAGQRASTINARLDGVDGAVAQLLGMLRQLGENVGQVSNAVGQMAADQAEDKQIAIRRGPDGRLVGATVGNKSIAVQRGRDGRMTGAIVGNA